MTLGVLFALAAGLMWGLVFMVPVWLPEYPPALLSIGRYLAFGFIALPLAWFDRIRLRQLTRSDWRQAAGLALVGNLVYYGCLSAAIQLAGVPLPTMIIGTLPVVIAIAANVWSGAGERLPWRRLVPSLLLIAAGLALVNHAELQHLRLTASQTPATTGLAAVNLQRHAWGALLAVAALVCWTIYPVLNARWLRAHPGRSAVTWATAQGVVTLPLAAVGYAVMAWRFDAGASAFAWPLGPTPQRFIVLMLVLGLLASWLGTWCWNEASQRLPTAQVGQLIVFETLAALTYALLWRGAMPPWTIPAGASLLVAGVMWALRSPDTPESVGAR